MQGILPSQSKKIPNEKRLSLRIAKFSFSKTKRSRSGTLHLTGTQTSGASIYVCRSTVYDSLYTSNIGLPGSVGSSVRVRNLDTEGYTLSADFTFCHAVAPPFQ